MKINTKTVFKDLSGKELKDGNEPLTLGIAIANILLTSKVNGKMKMFVLAQDFYNKESMEVDQADLSIIKKAAEETEGYNTIVTGQLLLILESIKTSK